MAQDSKLFRLVRHPLKVRTLHVKRVVALTPHMRRITLSGPQLEGFVTEAPEDHVKLFFPRPGEREPVLPTLGPLGLVLPAFGPKPLGRDYTPRRFDPEAQELDVDFFLHGQGVAASWALRAEPGMPLGVAGPRGSHLLTQTFPWHLFVGDETALPEFSRRIEQLPSHTRALAVVLVNGAREEHAPEARCALELRWVHRPDPAADASAALLEALSGLALPEGRGFTWLAGEAGEMRSVYRYLLQERGLPNPHVHVSGHWKRGVANHDHHEPIGA